MDESKKNEIRESINKEKKRQEYTRYFTRTGIRKALKDNGAMLVSDNAVDELGYLLKDIITDISINAVLLSAHARRKTVKAEDIKIATR